MRREADPQDLDEQRRLLDEWARVRRQIAALQAREAELLIARIAGYEADANQFPVHRDAIHRSMVSEYAAAGRVAKGAVESAFLDARMLRDHFPAVRAAFRAGSITAAHVREIVLAGLVVVEAVQHGRADAGAVTVFEVAALVVAEQDTPGRTRVHSRQVASAVAGETEKERHTRARRERGVTVRSVGDGLAMLSIVLPEYLVAAIYDRLTRLAREIVDARDDWEPPLDPSVLDLGEDPIFPEDIDPADPSFDPYEAYGEDPAPAETPTGDAIFAGDTFTTDPLRGLIDPAAHPDTSPDVEHIPADTRTLDEIRADILTDLLLAAEPSEVLGTGLDGITGHIQVTVGAATLAGADDRLAELDGHGPLHPDVARDLAARCGPWTRLFLDPAGMVVETDTYAPTSAMRRHLRARDQHCRFPGCRMPALASQIDHNHDHAKGGRTHLCNLCCFCAAHHALKHPDIDERFRWYAHALPDGSIEWLSPLGRTYTDPPPRRVMFV